MARRDPDDPRCKDCPEPHAPRRARCEACAERHRQAAAKARERRLRAKLCVVCGKPAAMRADLRRRATVCATHAEYYSARDAAVRAAR